MWDDIKQNIIFFLFLNLGAVPRIHLQANSHTFDMNLSELEYDEYTRHSLKTREFIFNKDVFPAVAVFVPKAL